MTSFEAGEIILIAFPFTDLTSTKQRPAVVLNPPQYISQWGDLVLAPLTSQPQQQEGLAISQWENAGLLKRTWIKPIIFTLSSALVVRRLGRLDTRDYSCVRSALSILLAEQWHTTG